MWIRTTLMIEGTRYKVNLLLLWLVTAPLCGYGQNSPCMQSVWIGIDSGVPVKKLMRYHIPFCTRSLLAFSCLKCSSQVNLDLEASRIFRPTPHTTLTTPHTTFWSNFRKHVNTDKAPRQCTLSGLESILAFLSRSLCGIMRREAQTV